MRRHALLFSLFILITLAACSPSEKELRLKDHEIKSLQGQNKRLKEKVEKLENEIKKLQAENEELRATNKALSADVTDNEPSDCIFDQSTQNDAFLKGIAELSNYTWNADKHTATILLSNTDTLYISRGGCYDFGVSAEFSLMDVNESYSDFEKAKEKVLWVTSLLKEDFDHDLLVKAFENKAYSTAEFIPDVYSFDDEMLASRNYSMVNDRKNNRARIVISWYLN